MNPQRSEEERPHSILNVKPPSATTASIDSTRHTTLYIPGDSGGGVARSSGGICTIDAAVPAVHLHVAISGTQSELYAGSRRSVKESFTSSGERFSLLSTGGSARSRTACLAATLVVSRQVISAGARRLALTCSSLSANRRVG